MTHVKFPCPCRISRNNRAWRYVSNETMWFKFIYCLTSVFLQNPVIGLGFKKFKIMKKLLMLVSLATTVSFMACGQKLDAAKVPAAAKATFAKQHPGVTATWEKEDGKYEATFKQNGMETSAFYEDNGTMTESEQEMKVTDLPATIQAYLAEHYKGKKIKSAAKITKADGTVNYEANVNGKDAMFDASGKFLKEVKD